MYGIVQAAQDIDLIANLQLEHIDSLLAQLQRDYYFSERSWKQDFKRNSIDNYS